ncbi:MAG: hypothetical protein HC835_17750 [Oscillatoriales cyanobacterium RM2_1_1]|nr:hypothetical protein [Oscillatoriales cyanobacterium SM2_3_0]NJO47305.1 hypothetical protein [Oscillatoriales cyanobacterium RM2_1_1]
MDSATRNGLILFHQWLQALQSILVPICFVIAWSLLLLIFWSMVRAIADTLSRARQMHQVPCANCKFFTKNYYLKCPVQPTIALSEQAIDCPDYSSVGG